MKGSRNSGRGRRRPTAGEIGISRPNIALAVRVLGRPTDRAARGHERRASSVVTTDGGRSAIRSSMTGETGYLVPKRDPAALAQRVVELLRNEPLRRRMGRRDGGGSRNGFASKAMGKAWRGSSRPCWEGVGAGKPLTPARGRSPQGAIVIQSLTTPEQPRARRNFPRLRPRRICGASLLVLPTINLVRSQGRERSGREGLGRF